MLFHSSFSLGAKIIPWYLHTERWNSVFWTWSNFGVLVVMAGMLLFYFFFFSKHFMCFLRQSQLNLFRWWIMNWGFQPVTEAILWNFALCCDTRLFSLHHLSLSKESSALPSLMHTSGDPCAWHLPVLSGKVSMTPAGERDLIVHKEWSQVLKSSSKAGYRG